MYGCCFACLETYKQFLEEEFDARSYANSIIQGRAISESLAKLADGVDLLDKELHAQVGLTYNVVICASSTLMKVRI